MCVCVCIASPKIRHGIKYYLPLLFFMEGPACKDDPTDDGDSADPPPVTEFYGQKKNMKKYNELNAC